MRWQHSAFGFAIPALLAAAPVYAETYFSVEEAQKVLMPDALSFVERTQVISPRLIKEIESRGDFRFKSGVLRLFEAMGKDGRIGFVVIDQVYGKHEYITYAVAVSEDLTVIGIEVLEYLETYGFQIREKAWRDQFKGKTEKSAFALDQDIANISGATLSCAHVTKGVRRVLTTLGVVKIELDSRGE